MFCGFFVGVVGVVGLFSVGCFVDFLDFFGFEDIDNKLTYLVVCSTFGF